MTHFFQDANGWLRPASALSCFSHHHSLCLMLYSMSFEHRRKFAIYFLLILSRHPWTDVSRNMETNKGRNEVTIVYVWPVGMCVCETSRWLCVVLMYFTFLIHLVGGCRGRGHYSRKVIITDVTRQMLIRALKVTVAGWRFSSSSQSGYSSFWCQGRGWRHPKKIYLNSSFLVFSMLPVYKFSCFEYFFPHLHLIDLGVPKSALVTWGTWLVLMHHLLKEK